MFNYGGVSQSISFDYIKVIKRFGNLEPIKHIQELRNLLYEENHILVTVTHSLTNPYAYSPHPHTFSWLRSGIFMAFNLV